MNKTELINNLNAISRKSATFDSQDYEELANLLDKTRDLIHTDSKLANVYDKFIDDMHITHPDDEGDLQLEQAYRKGFSKCADEGGYLLKSVAKLADYDASSYVFNNYSEVSPYWKLISPYIVENVVNRLIKAIKK